MCHIFENIPLKAKETCVVCHSIETVPKNVLMHFQNDFPLAEEIAKDMI